MDNDSNALCEKIVSEIYAVFHKDPDLISFEVIPMVSNQNKSPVVHIEHNLGLESWCIKHVYEYVHKIVITYKLGHSKHFDNNNLVKYINCAILINPDVTTYWNIRRQFFIHNKLDITKEFQFSSIVLSKKPKSSEAFYYRRWLYSFRSSESIDWMFELSLCEKCADKNLSNYHAWCHRQWVLQKAPNLLLFELNKTEKFIRKHVTDYSCYHHRYHVLTKIRELNLFDEDECEYKEIKNFLHEMLTLRTKTNNDILTIVMPDTDLTHLSVDGLKSYLFCINIALYDLKFCKDLKQMYGEREAFENYRRSILQYIISDYKTMNNIINIDKTRQLTNKIYNKTTKNNYNLIEIFQMTEGKRSEKHKKWCQLFLDFSYDDSDDDVD